MSKTAADKRVPAGGRGGVRVGRKVGARAVLAPGAAGAPPGFVATYPKSGVAHQQSLVFEDAARGSVLLRERAGRNFVLVSEEQYRRQARAATEAAALLPMLDAPPERIPELPGYAWTASLPVEDRASFQHDSRLQLRRALEEGDWSAYDRTRERWRDTAGMMADPDLHARMLEDWDAEDEVEIRRP